MYILDFYDILFLSKLSNSHHHISTSIITLATFSHANTGSSTINKLHHVHTHNNWFFSCYFNRLPRLWNSLPPMDLTKPFSSIKTAIYNYLWNHFKQNFLSTNPCTFHFCCRCTNWGLINNFVNLNVMFNCITNFMAVSTGCWQSINTTEITSLYAILHVNSGKSGSENITPQWYSTRGIYQEI